MEIMNLYIDSDSLLYRASHLVCNKGDEALREAEALEVDDTDEELGLDEAIAEDTMNGMKRIFHSMTKEIEDAVKERYPDIEETIHVLTVKPKLDVCKGMEDNFRYFVMNEVSDPVVKGYKSNRAGMEVPDGLNAIYEHVFKLPNTICVSGVEADDVCVRMGIDGHIVAALDKDVLGSLESAYNYGKSEWVENKPEDVARFPYIQTITGDTSDGLRGVYRVGIKGAEKALTGIDPFDDLAMWGAVVKQYALKDQTMEEAVATMRCVRMDGWDEERGLTMWNPPNKANKG